MSMGAGGETSGTSTDVPVCRTYTPVGLKPMWKKKAKMKKNEKKNRGTKNLLWGRIRENVCFPFNLGCNFLYENVI